MAWFFWAAVNTVGAATPPEAAVLRALLQVDLDPERRQRLLEALHSEGVLS